MAPTAPPRTSSRRTSAGNGNGGPADQRSLRAPVEAFHPTPDTQTYRDLLIFEERLKQNAARLVKRKKKYQTFLVLLCATISFFSYHVVLHPQAWQPLHYLNVTILLVTATMLFLFFASGMYAERIAAANKFVPQANRSLRNFNMYLNTRIVPHRSFISVFTPSTSAAAPSSVTQSTVATPVAGEASVGQARRVAAQHQTSARRLHIPAIPPTFNPRGELIFSSKVTPNFREGYERYRAAFERRRKEKMEERQWKGWRGWWGMGTKAPDRSALGAKTVVGHARQSAATSFRGSPRQSKLRTRSGTNASLNSLNSLTGSQTSSRASSRASSPSPPSEKRLVPRGRKQDEEEVERRGRDRTPSVTVLSERRTRSGQSRQSTGEVEDDAAVESGIAEEGQAVVSPDPSSVARTADDRSAPEATLREPDGGDGDSTADSPVDDE